MATTPPASKAIRFRWWGRGQGFSEFQREQGMRVRKCEDHKKLRIHGVLNQKGLCKIKVLPSSRREGGAENENK